MCRIGADRHTRRFGRQLAQQLIVQGEFLLRAILARRRASETCIATETRAAPAGNAVKVVATGPDYACVVAIGGVGGYECGSQRGTVLRTRKLLFGQRSPVGPRQRDGSMRPIFDSLVRTQIGARSCSGRAKEYR